jgi:hypothetical protein
LKFSEVKLLAVTSWRGSVMTASLCHLVYLPELWGSCVLSNLKARDVARLDTALFGLASATDRFEPYRSMPPVSLPAMRSVNKLEFALTWLFRRGATIKTMILELEYLKSGQLQGLLADNIQAVKGGVTLLCSDDLTVLSTAAYFIRQVLIDKVESVVVALSPESTP